MVCLSSSTWGGRASLVLISNRMRSFSCPRSSSFYKTNRRTLLAIYLAQNYRLRNAFCTKAIPVLDREIDLSVKKSCDQNITGPSLTLMRASFSANIARSSAVSRWPSCVAVAFTLWAFLSWSCMSASSLRRSCISPARSFRACTWRSALSYKHKTFLRHRKLC